MKVMDNDNKKVQDLTLELLKVYMAFCEKNDLRYYVGGGALIGVVRHRGFIPWDDDIDIVMPRKDYDRFLALLEDDMPEGYGICNRFTDKNWHFAMSQFIDEESEVEIKLAKESRYAHIWIDVFPLDGLPNNRICRWLRINHILFYRYLVQIANIDTQVDAQRSRPMLERVLLKIFSIIPIGKLVNTDKVITRLENLLRKSDFENSIYVGNMLGRYRKREVVPSEFFGEPQSGIFEGIKVNIPEKTHEYLTAIYGDYMELPPKSQRISHNVKILRCRNVQKNNVEKHT